MLGADGQSLDIAMPNSRDSVCMGVRVYAWAFEVGRWAEWDGTTC